MSSCLLENQTLFLKYSAILIITTFQWKTTFLTSPEYASDLELREVQVQKVTWVCIRCRTWRSTCTENYLSVHPIQNLEKYRYGKLPEYASDPELGEVQVRKITWVCIQSRTWRSTDMESYLSMHPIQNLEKYRYGKLVASKASPSR